MNKLPDMDEETIRRFGLRRIYGRRTLAPLPYLRCGRGKVFCKWTLLKDGSLQSVCEIDGIDSEPHLEKDFSLTRFIGKYLRGENIDREIDDGNKIILKHIEEHEREIETKGETS